MNPLADTSRSRAWYLDRPFLVELFIFSNLAFLILDVFIAHSINAFAHPAEWIPVYFAAAGSVLLAVGLWVAVRRGGGPVRARFEPARGVGLAVGWLAIAVGIAGLIWHLESQFFAQSTLHHLVYSAPFAAPLSFAGLGFLLLLNRMVDTRSLEWGRWVVFLALGGFVGNFALSLGDHAQNGFFEPLEWVPVFSAAMAIGFLVVAIFRPLEGAFFALCYAVLALQLVTGVAGFGLHLASDWWGPSARTVDNFLYGAPVFAPLLFADLSLLAAIGLWDVRVKERAAHTP